MITQILRQDKSIIDDSFHELLSLWDNKCFTFWNSSSQDQIFLKLLYTIDDLCNDLSSYGGFIAGGFVRDLLNIRYKLFDFKNEDVSRAVLSRLGYGLTTKFRAINKHDVDIFFESKEGCKAFCDEKLSTYIDYDTVRSLADNALEFYINNKKVQIIDSRFGSPEDVISGFDLLPAKVAINNKTIFLDDRWKQYETNKCLHVDEWTSINTVNRVYKYLKRGYTSISQETKNNMLKIVDSYMKLSQQEKLNILHPKSLAYNLISIIESLGENFSAKDLMSYVPYNLPNPQVSYTKDEINGFRNAVMQRLLKQSTAKLFENINIKIEQPTVSTI